MSLKAVIIDDETSSVEVLTMLLEKYCPDVEVIGKAENAENGRRLVDTCIPDIVFLDIEMPLGTGFDMLDRLEYKDFQVIFITAYNHYAFKAIKYCALDYLLKPVDIDELIVAVDKVTGRSRKQSDHALTILKEYLRKENTTNKIAIPTANGLEFVSAQDIIRCEAQANYTRIYLQGGRQYLVTRTLKEYEEQLVQYNFLRIHHAHLINLNYIEKYIKGEGGYAVMSDGSVVDISKRKKKEFLSRFTGSI